MEKILQYDDVIDLKKSSSLIEDRIKEVHSFTFIPSIQEEQQNWLDYYLIQIGLPKKK